MRVFSGLKVFLTAAILAAGLGFVVSGATAAERTMIVLDGSGSMWGQIDGVPKLTIARETLREVLPQVPAETELGLMSYGHREKGNCDDIEIIVPPAPGTAGQISGAADALSFLGMTPLTAAVQIAAENMRYTENVSTVILITDGIETCEADPCALGNLLEEQGVNFTAHVVGFGLSEEEGRQVACLAENTGGQYISAENEAALVEALNTVVVAAPPPTPDVTLIARDQNDVDVTEYALNWFVQDLNGASVHNSTGTSANETLEPGEYMVLVEGDGIAGGTNFTVAQGDADQTIYVPVEIEVLSATVDGPESAPIGGQFEVDWTGPNDERDYVTIVELGADEGTFISYSYTGNENPSVLTAPDGLGTYELRYVHGPTDRTLATAEIEITAVEATLDAPETVGAGAAFEVNWTGPDNQRDFITIVEVGADEGTFESYSYTRNANPAELTAPDGLGTYEIRYVLDQSDRTLASTTIEVTAVEATLEVPEAVPAGSEFEVIWTGPDNVRDFITIVEVGADEGTYTSYAYTRNGSPSTISAPDGLGTYEIRYVLDLSDRTLASTTIEVTGVSGTLNAPESVPAGAEFEVEWTGPDNTRDFLAIAETGAAGNQYFSYAYSRNGSPASLTAPDAVGTFELRYVLDQTDRVLVSRSIEVTAVSAELSVLNNPVPGGQVQVEWTGPDNARDYIAFAEIGSDGDEYFSYKYTRNGSPAALDVPQALGQFEIRYIMAQTKRIVASIPVTLAVASAEVRAPASVAAGGVVEVTWTGPANREDFIEIVPAGAAADAAPISETRTVQGSPLQIFAPGTAGDFEVRYKMRDTGEVLASAPLSVE